MIGLLSSRFRFFFSAYNMRYFLLGKDKSILLILLIAFPSSIFSNTLFKTEKSIFDPFIAEQGDVNSLFVNPAGAAGQSGFTLDIDTNFKMVPNDLSYFLATTEIMSTVSRGNLNTDSLDDITQNFSQLYQNGVINDDYLDSMFEGTTLDPDVFTSWDDISAVETLVQGGSVDLNLVQTNIFVIIYGSPGNAQYDDFYSASPSQIENTAQFSAKVGFLIKGFGLGIYNNTMGVAGIDFPNQFYGISSLRSELGLIAGGGFTIFDGKFSLGFSGNYGLLIKNGGPINFEGLTLNNIFTASNNGYNYGYNMGLDIGAIWHPLSTLSVGLVLDDILGYTEFNTPHTVANLFDIFIDKKYFPPQFQYQITTDVSLGITWQPNISHTVQNTTSFDFYDIVRYSRAIESNSYNFEDAFVSLHNYIRIGTRFTFFDFLTIGAQYYREYLGLGLEFELLFAKINAGFKIHEDDFWGKDFNNKRLSFDFSVQLHF